MKAFYSILYIPVRPSSDERISIALLFREGDRIIFKYSNTKLNIIKNLLPDSVFNLVKVFLKNLDFTINDQYPNSFAINNSQDIVTQSYLSHLSNHSKNLINFSEPRTIDLKYNEANFIQLFNKYVFDYIADDTTDVTVYKTLDRVKKNLYPNIRGKVNLEAVLTNKEVPNLLIPTKINFVGQNDIPLAGQVLEFNKKHLPSLEYDITRFVGLIRAFEQEQKKGKYFVIGKEPAKKLKVQHDIWNQIRKSPDFEFVPLSELDLIESYIDQHNVSPFISYEKSDFPQSRINLKEQWEVTYWTKKWNISKDQLEMAIKKANSRSIDKVKDVLGVDNL